MAISTGYRVCDIMTRKPISVTPDMTVKECALLMQEKNVGSLAVKTADTLSGYITEQMIVKEIVAKGKDASKVKAGDIMAKRVVTIHPNADIMDALKKMRENDVRQLPVIDAENSNKLVGLLTMKDILNVQPQMMEILEEKLPLQEEERKRTSIVEGTCDACSKFSTSLHEINDEFICEKCTLAKKH
ncbi:MAG: CBS domain-containing protein [Candidatus Woesearchaeota archaeon]